jgi:hypothetical protein
MSKIIKIQQNKVLDFFKNCNIKTKNLKIKSNITTKEKDDVISIHYLKEQIDNYVLYLDTINKTILFYHNKNIKDCFKTNDDILNNFIKDEILSYMISKL